MARVTAPLLSLSASGKFADTLVASSWKGIPVMRQYVKPSNPDTEAQGDQRDMMTACVSVWRNSFTNTLMRTAWNRLALLMKDTMSGFNAFISNAVKAGNTDPAASFAELGEAIAGLKVSFDLLNLDDGATGDETGDFEIWAGSSPGSLLLIEEIAIVAGAVIGATALGDEDDVVYAKLRKGGRDRSGLVQITLITA